MGPRQRRGKSQQLKIQADVGLVRPEDQERNSSIAASRTFARLTKKDSNSERKDSFVEKMHMSQLKYHHVDVFAPRPFSGNSLTVFLDAGSLHRSQMMRITQEMRHFESIFLSPAGAANTFDAQVFDLTEELDFAGHPLLGAAAVCIPA